MSNEENSNINDLEKQIDSGKKEVEELNKEVNADELDDKKAVEQKKNDSNNKTQNVNQNQDTNNNNVKNNLDSQNLPNPQDDDEDYENYKQNIGMEEDVLGIWKRYKKKKKDEEKKEDDIDISLKETYDSLNIDDDIEYVNRDKPNYDELFEALHDYTQSEEQQLFSPVNQANDTITKDRKEQFDQVSSETVEAISKEQRDNFAKMNKINFSTLSDNDVADNLSERKIHYDFLDSSNITNKGIRKFGMIASDVVIGLPSFVADTASGLIKNVSKKVNEAANGFMDAATSGSFFGFIMGIMGLATKLASVGLDLTSTITKGFSAFVGWANNGLKKVICGKANTHIYDFCKAMEKRLNMNNVETQKKQEELKRLQEEFKKCKNDHERDTKRKQIAALNLDIKKMALESDQINKFFRSDPNEKQKVYDKYKERITGLASANLYHNGERDRDLYSKLKTDDDRAMQGVMDYFKDTINYQDVVNSLRYPDELSHENPKSKEPEKEIDEPIKKKDNDKFNESEGGKGNPDEPEKFDIDGEGETIKNEQNNIKNTEFDSGTVRGADNKRKYNTNDDTSTNYSGSDESSSQEENDDDIKKIELLDEDKQPEKPNNKKNNKENLKKHFGDIKVNGDGMTINNLVVGNSKDGMSINGVNSSSKKKNNGMSVNGVGSSL